MLLSLIMDLPLRKWLEVAIFSNSRTTLFLEFDHQYFGVSEPNVFYSINWIFALHGLGKSILVFFTHWWPSLDLRIVRYLSILQYLSFYYISKCTRRNSQGKYFHLSIHWFHPESNQRSQWKSLLHHFHLLRCRLLSPLWSYFIEQHHVDQELNWYYYSTCNYCNSTWVLNYNTKTVTRYELSSPMVNVLGEINGRVYYQGTLFYF